MNSPQTLMSAGALGAAVAAAREVGLLHELLDGPLSALALAHRLGVDPWATSVVIDVLRAHGIVEEGPEGLVVSSAVRSELRGPAGHRTRDTALWARTTHFLRTGETMLDDKADGLRDRVYHDVVPRLGELFAAAATRLATTLAPLLPPDARILDVGAGSGVWSLAMIAPLRGARAIGLDLQHTVSRFEERAIAMGLDGRTETITGDFHQIDIPAASVDAVVFANVLHLEGPEQARRLVHRYAAALKPRGRIVIVDALPDGPGAAPHLTGYGLHLALRLPGARPHTVDDVRGWLEEAGLPFVMHVPLEDQGLMGALIGTR